MLLNMTADWVGPPTTPCAMVTPWLLSVPPDNPAEIHTVGLHVVSTALCVPHEWNGVCMNAEMPSTSCGDAAPTGGGGGAVSAISAVFLQDG